MKRESGAAYLAKRDAEAGEGQAAKRPRGATTLPLQRRTLGSSFVDLLLEGTHADVDFRPLLSSRCEGGRLAAAVRADGSSAEKTVKPRCAWWTLEHGGQPVGPVHSSVLDLAQLDKAVAVVALVADAEEEGKRTVVTEHSDQGAKATPAWTAALGEGAPRPSRELVRLRRGDGVQPGGVWLVAVIAREAEGSGWHALAIDEVYPAKRLKALLPLRCKDLVKAAEPPAEEDPMEKTRRLLAEAMKSS
mmetsp:Transcript_2611/g.6079  ORF Transcript_2611/g.6079 Transcript_2611/m.6079 type:complete len:247 (+) Transcript_2611:2-742(+)